YSDDFFNHQEVKIGLMVFMEKFIPKENERLKAILRVYLFKHKEGLFSYGLAKTLIHIRTPFHWWTAFINETLELSTFDVKILSLTCLSSVCEMNLSTFNM
ncbi:hypothetical protein Ddye_002100, partial [Dipteronia dyeriana]